MKQAQSETTWYRADSRWQLRDLTAAEPQGRINGTSDHKVRVAEPLGSWLWRDLLGTSVAVLWLLITLPFRLIFRLIAWLGRLTAMLLGFVLMVVGIALWAGPLFFVGIPVFIIGLFVTLRCFD